MSKWAQLTRKWHRWIAIPMLIMVPLSAVLRLSGNAKVVKDLPAIDAVQSILILLLALTGGYLYLFRLVNKKKRQRRTATVASQSPTSSQ